MNISAGMSSPLAGLAAINAICFGIYGNALEIFEDKTAPFSQFVAGATSGFAQTVICCPMELTKLRVQVRDVTALTIVQGIGSCSPEYFRACKCDQK